MAPRDGPKASSVAPGVVLHGLSKASARSLGASPRPDPANACGGGRSAGSARREAARRATGADLEELDRRHPGGDQQDVPGHRVAVLTGVDPGDRTAALQFVGAVSMRLAAAGDRNLLRQS